MSHETRDPVTGKFRTEVLRSIKDVDSSVVTYYGQTYGTDAAYSDPVWQIKKETRIGTVTEIVPAGKGEYEYAWSDRTSLFPTPAFFNEASTLFDGVNDRVEFGNVFNYDNANQWSLSIWLKPDNLAAGRVFYSKSTNDANVYGWTLYQQAGGTVFLQMRAPAQTRQHNGALLLTAAAWNHFVLTYDGSSNISGVRMYVNGVQDTIPASGAVTNSLLSGQTAMIGMRNTSFAFSGLMDEMAVYNKALSAAEVTGIYNSGSPNDLTTLPSSANLQNYYRLGDGDAAPTILDNVGSVNGTMVNMGTVFSSDVP